jgi:hypothetical protein
LFCFGDRLDHGVSGQKEASHVIDEKKMFCDSPKNTKRGLKIEHVAHDGEFALLREEMIVIETLESAANHRVSEMQGPYERRDATGEMLPRAKVTGPPGHLFSQLQQPARHPRHGALACVSGRGHVQLYASRQIEDAFKRGADFGGKLDDRHKSRRVRASVSNSYRTARK